MSKVLIADDNRSSRDLIRAVLKGVCEVMLEARNGQEALDMISREQPDLVLLDIDMPVLDGYAVIRRLRGDPRWATLPVVAVTAFAMQGDREKVLAAGFTAHTTKPVRAAALRKQVQEILNKDVVRDHEVP